MPNNRRALVARVSNFIDTPARKPEINSAQPESMPTARKPTAIEKFTECSRLGWTNEAWSEWLTWSKATCWEWGSVFLGSLDADGAYWIERDGGFYDEVALIPAKAKKILESFGSDRLEDFDAFWEKLLKIFKHGHDLDHLEAGVASRRESGIRSESETLRREGILCR